MFAQTESCLPAASSVAALLEVRNLTRSFGTIRALDGASFTVLPGEILGLIGPNGAGKTTLLECVAGLMPSDGGDISGGTGVAGTSSMSFYVPDAIVPWDAHPIGWVLRFFEALHASAPGLRESLIQDLALGDLLAQTVGGVSRGQRKRVLLALGLLTPHPLLLLDEPFDGLDVRQVREISAVLRAHASAGRTLFLSIHQLTDAERVCDRMVLLNAGKVVGIGTLAELRAQAATNGNLEDVFLALT